MTDDDNLDDSVNRLLAEFDGLLDNEDVSVQRVDDGDIGRRSLTITGFMNTMGVSGGVDLDDGAKSAAAVATLVDEQGQKYEMGEVVAKGGMGAIVRARDLNCRRQVAMKVMLEGNHGDEAILRFIEEGQVTGQLEHPNIVPLHEIGCDASDNLFFTMKFVKGRNLQEILDAICEGDEKTVHEFPLGRLMVIFQKVCDAMAFAHARGIVHRDLKPDNIMVGDFGEVQVMDWGLAKILKKKGRKKRRTPKGAPAAAKQATQKREVAAWILEEVESDRLDASDACRTIAGQIMGTPMYMAPEQAHGNVDAIDPRTDIYALGAILYTVLTLRSPIQGNTMNIILMNVANGEITAPERAEMHGVAPHLPHNRVPESLSAVAMKAMALSQAERYRRVTDLQADITAWQQGFATSAEETDTRKMLTLLIKRHKAVSAIAGVSLLVLLGVVAAFLVQLNGESQVAQQKRERAKELLADYGEFESLTASMQRASASLTLANARKGFADKQWAQALRYTEEALETAPELGDGDVLFMYGRLLLGHLRFKEANQAFMKAREKDPDGFGRRVKRLNFWSVKSMYTANRQGGKLNLSQIVTLAEDLEEHDAAVSEAVIAQLADATDGSITGRLQVARKLMELNNPKLKKLRFKVYDKPYVIVDISGNEQLRDITALRGLPIEGLLARGSGIDDLSPLKGAPLITLDVSHSNVSDLTPVRGMPLREVSLNGCREVRDISPLKGAPIVWLQLADIGVDDDGLKTIATLNNVRRLDLSGSMITDVSPILHLRPETLGLARCNGVRDIRGLSKMTGLTKLTVPHNLKHELGFLKKLPSLALLDQPSATERAPLRMMEKPAAEFWQQYDSGLISLHRALAAANPAYTGEGRFKVEDGKIVEVDLDRCKITDLSPLRGLPLRTLKVTQNPGLSDLSPLADMPLEKLLAFDTAVSDISVVKKMPLRVVHLVRTRVDDLTPLNIRNLIFLGTDAVTVGSLDWSKAESLKGISLEGGGVQSVSFLRTVPNLESVILPPSAVAYEFLRERSTITELSTQWYNEPPPASQFWRRYDETRRPIEAAIAQLERDNPRAKPIRHKILIPAKLSNAYLDLRGNPELRDISALQGLMLESLSLSGKVSDLSPIASKGAVLQTLDLSTCTALTNRELQPLQVNTKLKALLLPKLPQPRARIVKEPSKGLIAHLPLADGKGASARSTVGGVKGTLSPEVVWHENSAWFSGNNSYVELPAFDELGNLKAFSVAAWVRADRFNRGILFVIGPRSTQLQIALDNQGHISLDLHDRSDLLRSLRPIANRRWHHVAVTCDSQSKAYAIFIDGVEAARQRCEATLKFAGKPTYIGGMPRLQSFPGLISNVRMYDRVLSGKDVQALASARPLGASEPYLPNIVHVLPPDTAGKTAYAFTRTNPGWRGYGRFLHRNGKLTGAIVMGPNVVNLAFLRGQPLTYVNLTFTRIRDAQLRYLAGMPITNLSLAVSPITDRGVAQLPGLPLRTLNLQACRISDVSPLRKVPTLESVVLPWVDIKPLDGHPKLKHIDRKLAMHYSFDKGDGNTTTDAVRQVKAVLRNGKFIRKGASGSAIQLSGEGSFLELDSSITRDVRA
jgi:serine/threonine protein kinase/Leucine-rich repeat (LRR) protein